MVASLRAGWAAHTEPLRRPGMRFRAHLIPVWRDATPKSCAPVRELRTTEFTFITNHGDAGGRASADVNQ
jgi:hypothetical protein